MHRFETDLGIETGIVVVAAGKETETEAQGIFPVRRGHRKLRRLPASSALELVATPF